MAAWIALSPDRCHMDAAPTAPHGPSGQGASVLVVDDEASMRRILRRTLEAENFQVEEASDGESALRIIQSRTEPFDLVLTDLSMPLIDGRRVTETLTRYRPSVAVLCMSADPDAVPYIESSDTPVRVMLKPFTSEDLVVAAGGKAGPRPPRNWKSASLSVRSLSGFSGGAPREEATSSARQVAEVHIRAGSVG